MHFDLPELYVLRHGETVWNREGRMQGGQDSPLTPRGVEQAQAAGRWLAARGVTGASHLLICSPQGRALATAVHVGDAMGADAVRDPRLREIGMGRWAGLNREEIVSGWPGPPGEHFIDFYARAPGGEGFSALEARVAAFLRECNRPAVIVTHGMTSRMLRALVLGLGRAGMAGLEGGQDCIFRLADGQSEVFATSPDRTLARDAPPG